MKMLKNVDVDPYIVDVMDNDVVENIKLGEDLILIDVHRTEYPMEKPYGLHVGLLGGGGDWIRQIGGFNYLKMARRLAFDTILYGMLARLQIISAYYPEEWIMWNQCYGNGFEFLKVGGVLLARTVDGPESVSIGIVEIKEAGKFSMALYDTVPAGIEVQLSYMGPGDLEFTLCTPTFKYCSPWNPIEITELELVR